MSSRRRHPGFDGDNITGFENEAMEAQIRFETSWDQKRKNYSSKKFEKKEWERPPLVFGVRLARRLFRAFALLWLKRGRPTILRDGPLYLLDRVLNK